MSNPASAMNRAKLAYDMGYNVAGFVEEIYLGAEILIPEMMFGHISEYGDMTDEETARYNKGFVCGRVIQIQPITPYFDDADHEDIMFYDGDVIGTTSVVTHMRTTPHFVVNFILQTDEGYQLHQSYGRTWDIFFRIPLDEETSS